MQKQINGTEYEFTLNAVTPFRFRNENGFSALEALRRLREDPKASLLLLIRFLHSGLVRPRKSEEAFAADCAAQEDFAAFAADAALSAFRPEASGAEAPEYENEAAYDELDVAALMGNSGLGFEWAERLTLGQISEVCRRQFDLKNPNRRPLSTKAEINNFYGLTPQREKRLLEAGGKGDGGERL
jgi:hypothetical protein